MQVLDLETQEYCGKIGLDVKTIQKIDRYIQLLKKANQTCNLIGRQQDDYRICHYHVVDCLLPLVYWPENITSVYDIGTGAGLPGMVWALIKPEIQFYLVEKSPKKCLFLTETVSALQLKNIQIINKRSDAVAGSASLIVSRAMASTKDLLEQTRQLANAKTQWWLLKALKSSIDAELAEVDQSEWKVNVKPLEHPTQDVSRNLVCIARS